MHYDYEVHIVSYGASDLTHVPQPFFLNRIDASSQGFSGIATVETESVIEAHTAFEAACAWCAQQQSRHEFFGAHVKLEQLRESIRMRNTEHYAFALVREQQIIHSTTIGAWDVHLDGTFDPRTKKELVNAGYIVLDYIDSDGQPATTLTQHFLRQESCLHEFWRICSGIKRFAGFQGVIYWEDPLAFAVFGEKNNIPRPIVV